MQHALPHLRASEHASIVDAVSAGAYLFSGGLGLDAAAKAAMASYTRSLAAELAPDGIRVNALAPGAVDTHMTRATGEVGMAHMAPASLMQRIARPDEMVGPALFLASDAASFVTGTVLHADGGLVASWPPRAYGGRGRTGGRHMADLEIDVVASGTERDTLVAAFRAGTLALADLPRLRFRLGPDDEWREHPQVRFLHLPVEPEVPVDGPPLVWQQRVTHSPCGLLEVWHRFDWGRKVESALGRHPTPDVTVTLGYEQVLAVMAGELHPQGAAERGAEVEGELAAMRQLLEVFNRPEFAAATRQAIGALGPALRAIAPPPA